MGKILFASNNPTHFGPLVTTNTSYVRDVSRVPFSLAFSATIQTPDGVIKPTTTGEVWIHFRGDTSNSNFSGAPASQALVVYDGSGNTLLVGNTSGNSPLVDWTFYDTAGSSVISNDKGNVQDGQGAWDIQFIFDGFSMTCNIYQNTVLLATLSHGANPNNVQQISAVRWGSSWYSEGSTGYISEVIISDSDTRLARLNMVRPQGVGFHTDWSGLIGTLADNNLNTGMTTVSVNQRQSVVLEAYSNPEIISNLVVASQHFRGANSPATIRHFIRAGGIDYDHASAFTVAFNNTVSETDYELNPATSLPWDLNDLGTTEFGFKSEA